MNEKEPLKRRIYEIIRLSTGRNFASHMFDLALMLLIILNVILLVWDTFPITTHFERAIGTIQTVSFVIFTIEYLLRLWTADYIYPASTPVKARIKFALPGEGLVDLLSILPFYIPAFPRGILALRSLQLMRIFRLFRINKYSNALNVIISVFRKKADQLISSCFVILVLMLTSSVVMYHLEHAVQPENFTSAFSALWWAFNAITTTGYGDIVPITVGGRVMAMLLSAFGIALIAVPTGIITAGFIQQAEHDKHATRAEDEDPFHQLICPHCGKPYFDVAVDIPDKKKLF